MGQVIPRQHPAVVLKSHYKALRALLAVALVAIAALAATVVIVANDNEASAPSNATASKQLPAGTRFDGGPDEGTRGISSGAGLPAGTRFDGGPDEGTRGLQPPAGMTYKAHAGGPRFIPMGPSN